MDSYYNVKRYALICALNAEIEAMKVANKERELSQSDALAYSSMDFFNKSEEFEVLAHKHNDQL